MDKFSELDDGDDSGRWVTFLWGDDDSPYRGFLGRRYLTIVTLFTAGYVGLLICYQMVWAVLTAAGIVLGCGMFTARYLFDAHGWKLLWLGVPLGFCWLGIFWLVLMGVG